MALPLRHELKFPITRTQLEVLRHTIGNVLTLDPNADKETRSYHIRSLYFDTVFDDALYDKIAGVKDRDKYRIRIYNLSDKIIHMECKTKVGSLISKRSVKISRDLADQLIAADPTGLEYTQSGLLRDVYREMRTRLLTIPVLRHDETILEVKYNRVLPPYIRDMLSWACPEAVQSAVSKYTLCRKYEEKEY